MFEELHVSGATVHHLKEVRNSIFDVWSHNVLSDLCSNIFYSFNYDFIFLLSAHGIEAHFYYKQCIHSI